MKKLVVFLCEVNDINPAHFRRMAEEATLGWPMVRERIAVLSAMAIEILKEGTLVQTSPDPKIAGHLSELVTQRCQRHQEDDHDCRH